MNDIDFIQKIIGEICDYAVKNNMKPNETLEEIAKNILYLLEICSFDNWNE